MWLERDQYVDRARQRPSRTRRPARAPLAQKREHHFRAYLDVEAGGGMAVVDDTVIGVRMLPTGFGGLRGGYDFYASDSTLARVRRPKSSVRAVMVGDGTGVMAGFGMQWGN